MMIAPEFLFVGFFGAVAALRNNVRNFHFAAVNGFLKRVVHGAGERREALGRRGFGNGGFNRCRGFNRSGGFDRCARQGLCFLVMKRVGEGDSHLKHMDDDCGNKQYGQEPVQLHPVFLKFPSEKIRCAQKNGQDKADRAHIGGKQNRSEIRLLRFCANGIAGEKAVYRTQDNETYSERNVYVVKHTVHLAVLFREVL